MTTILRNKEVTKRIMLKLIRNSWESTATAGNTHDKEHLEEHSQPNYSEIANQLLKTFAGQDNVQAAVNIITSSWILITLPPDHWRVCCIAFMQSILLTRKPDGSTHSFYRRLDILPITITNSWYSARVNHFNPYCITN